LIPGTLDLLKIDRIKEEFMSNLQFCVARRKAEIPVFVRVLRAIPHERQDYRPDPKSRTAVEIAWLLALEEEGLLSLIETGTVEWKETSPQAGLDEIVAAFERNSGQVNLRLEALDEATWEKKVKFLMGAGAAWEDSLNNMVWGFLFDAIHHHGQLSTYLRPMGGKVPSIYGPSADDPGQ
jgi:uncharacterized damage-inducible protein DinB